PPIPAPVRNLNKAKLSRLHEAAVAAVATRYTESVTKNSFLRPSRSVSQPKKSAPSTAPAREALLAIPISVLGKCRLVFKRPARLPASDTSGPSRVQGLPRPAPPSE